MKTHLQKYRQRGFVLNAEYMLFVIILVLGLVVGWVSIRDSFNAELIDTANAIEGAITFYYFNDPDRGLGPAAVPASLEFCQPGAGEGTASIACAPAGSVLPVQ